VIRAPFVFGVSLSLLLFAPAGCGLDLGGLGAAADASRDASSADDASVAAFGADAAGFDGEATGGDAADDSAAADEAGGFDATADATAAESGGDSSGNDAPVDAGSVDGGSPEGAPPDGTTPDASSTPDGSACTAALPAGWSLVVYASAGAACPADFAAHDLFGGSSAAPASCSCSCDVTETPACGLGTLATELGGTCTQAGSSIDFTGGACVPITASLAAHFGASALAPQGGACASSPQADSSQVSKAPARYCEVPAASADAVCNGSPPAGFASCIAASGDTPCPGGSAFAQRLVLEDDVALQCTVCSPCTITATCSGAILSTYADAACTDQQLVAALPVDGTCVATTANGVAVNSVSYSAQVTTTCDAGSSTATLGFVNPRTICCR
jgi:hypothetical protein